MNEVKVILVTSEKKILYVLTLQKNNNKKHYVGDVGETYLQKLKVIHRHIAPTTKHKSYGVNLVVAEHKLTLL